MISIYGTDWIRIRSPAPHTFETGDEVLAAVLRVLLADHEPLVVILLMQRGLEY